MSEQEDLPDVPEDCARDDLTYSEFSHSMRRSTGFGGSQADYKPIGRDKIENMQQ
jgi:hypothetical protein